MKLRGIWGSGDAHGNMPRLLPIITYIRKLSFHNLINNKINTYGYLEEKSLTNEGEKFLAKLKEKGLTNLIDLC